MQVFITMTLAALLTSCASVETQQSAQRTQALKQPEVSYPQFNGEQVEVQVLRYGIPQEIIAKYPELGDKKIGWGLYNRLLDELYDTGRFKFVEEKSAIQSKILANWALSESGAAVDLSSENSSQAGEQEENSTPQLETPRYLLYAEIFEFSVAHKEDIKGVSSEEENTTWIGVQIRMVNSNDGSFIPASGQGSSTTVGKAILLKADMAFDESTIGQATEQATQQAVLQLIKRMR